MKFFAWLSNKLNQRAERKAKEALDKKNARKEREELERKELESSRILAADKMAETYCAIKDGYCVNTCVHFDEGKVWRQCHVFGGELPRVYYTWEIIKPNCRLWK